MSTHRRVAVVTGGTRGIGRACTAVLARDGFDVVFCGRDSSPGAEVEREVPGAKFVQADVCDPADVTRMFDVAAELGGGRIAALVNNAGQVVDREFGRMSSEEWDQMIEANSRSVFLTTRCALDALIASRGAVVLSERASYVNGVAIPVDGGETAGFGPGS